MGNIIRVGIGGMGIGQGTDQIFTVVGSCIAIMLYDKKVKIGGMIHIMLGYSRKERENPTKYADTGIPYLVRSLVQQGASASHLVGAKIAGAGEMFSVDPKRNVAINNTKDVQDLLIANQIKLIASDCGGKKGRRVTFFLETGKIHVHVQGGNEYYL